MKAKLSIKKALSLIVVVVMLLTMIPVGMISVGADEPTIDLGNYDYATEYVIMNVEDWLLIAREAQDKDFSGITVKLGADLDFGGYTTIWDEAHAPATGEFPNAQYDGTKPSSGNEIAREYAATVPTLFNNFAGVFDGDGYTIRNAKFEEGGIARKALDGAEVVNVTFENVSVTDFYDYFAYGIVVGHVAGSFWMENVHVVDSAVYANTFNTFHFGSGAGMIGLVSADEGVEGAYVGIMDCSVDADVACGNYKSWGYGYGTGMIVGTVDSNVDFEMSYCQVSGTLNSIDWYAGAIGALYVGKEKTVAINDIAIDGLSMNSARGAVTDGVQSWGSLVGAISVYDNASVTIDRVNVTNTSIITNAHAVGGLIGAIEALNSPAVVGGPAANQSAGGTYRAGSLYAHETVEDYSVAISNIYVDAYLWSNITVTGTCGAAGLVNQVGQGNSSGDALGRVMAGELNAYNCYLGGTYISSNYDETLDTWTVTHGSGGIFRNISAGEMTINISNMVVAADFPIEPLYVEAPEGIADADDAAKKAYSAEVAKCVGLIAHGGHVRQKTTGDHVGGADGYLDAYVTASDIATTIRGEFNLFSWLNRKGGIHYNGVDIGRGDKAAYAPPVVDDSVAQVRPIEAAQMVQFDEDGFVTDVTGAIALVGGQAVGDDVRFIALAYVDEVASASATIVFKDAEGNEVKSFTIDVELLDGLTAVAGTEISAYEAEDFYAKKFMAATITGVPAADYLVEWTFSYVTVGGVTVSDTAIAELTIA